MVDQNIARVSKRFQMLDRRAKESLGERTSDTRQKDHSRMNVGLCGQRSEIASILGHDHQIRLDTALENLVIGIAETPIVAGMDDEMPTLGKEIERELRREAFVDEQPHWRQGLPEAGRPRGGFALA